jgi:hypothetical protein
MLNEYSWHPKSEMGRLLNVGGEAMLFSLKKYLV